MKKVGGSCLSFVLLICAVFLGAFFSPSVPEVAVVQADTDTWFYDRHDYFKKFDSSSGIFILRDNYAVYDKTDTFFGDITVRAESDMQRLNQDGTVTQFWIFSFEPVQYVRGEWEVTNLFSVDPSINSVTWSLPKRTPAGLYGVRVTAYEQATDSEGNKLFRPLILDEDDNPITNEQGVCDGGMILVEALDFNPNTSRMSVVEGVFVILYGDELSYINVTDRSGHSIYDAQTRGSSAGTKITVDVNVNGGAMIRAGLVEEQHNSAAMGNLTLAASVLLRSDPDIVEVRVEDVNGNLVSSELISVSVFSSHIELSILEQLPRAKYYLKVIDKRTDDIYGLYVIDNVGNDTFGGMIGGTVFVIIGLLLLAGAAFMMFGPRAAVYFHDRKYKTIERGIEEQQDKSWKAQSAKDSYKNSKRRTEESTEDMKSMNTEKRQTKGAGFLSRMAEGRMKREIARNAGLTMDEFREFEEKQKKSADARRSSLSDFRKMVEEGTGTFTGGFESSKSDSGEDKAKDESEGVTPPHEEREPGAPEIDLLDSIQSDGMDAEERENIIGKHSAGDTLKRLRDAIGEGEST